MAHWLAENGEAGGGDRPVVLLVEDEIFIRLATADWLRDGGFDVIEAASGGEALSLVHAGKEFDLLATDITMPGEPDGIGLARRVRELRPELPILVASSLLPDRATAVADRFLQKPYSPSELVQSARELVEPIWRNRTGNRAAS